MFQKPPNRRQSIIKAVLESLFFQKEDVVEINSENPSKDQRHFHKMLKLRGGGVKVTKDGNKIIFTKKDTTP